LNKALKAVLAKLEADKISAECGSRQI